MKLDYNPIEPGERQKAIYGINNATRKARKQWLQHAADVICSGQHSKVEQAFYQLARSNGVHEELSRAILGRNTSVNLLLAALR